MPHPPPPEVGDAGRLAALSRYDILDTPAEPGFDDVVYLACQLCATPVALVSVVTDERQWFKARVDFPHCETDLDSSVCAHALARPDEVLVIPDLTSDPRTAGNSLVTGEPFMRFYAGAPLVTPDGQALGTLCVIDRVPRPQGLAEAQRDNLKRLARQVVALLELRRAVAVRDAARAEEVREYRTRDALREAQAAVAAADVDLDAAFGAVVEGAMRAVPAAEGGVVELLDGGELRYAAARGSLAAEEGLRLSSTGSLAGHVASTRTPRRMAEAARDPYVRQDLVDRLGLRSAVVTPLLRGASVLGVLKLQSSRPDAFTDRDLDAIALFAGAATAGFAQDEAGRKLRATDAYWRGVFERLVEGMLVAEVVRDAAGGIADWRYVDVNAAWEGMVGTSRAEALGRTLREVIPGVEDAWVDEFAGVVETGEPLRFLRQVGVWGRWYEGNAFRLGGDRFAVTFLDVTERVGRERRQAALLEIQDRLRDIDDPTALQAVVGEVVGRALGVERVGYGTLSADGETFTVDADWTAPGFPSLAGRYRMDDYGLYAADLRRGDTVVIDDVRLDPRTVASAEALEAVSARALVNVPVVEGGRTVAILYANAGSPHPWTGEEVVFAREAAERTRAVVERRRAERGLRDLAASLERQVEERTRERDRLWRLARDPFVIADAQGRWISVNPACSAVLGWSADEMTGRTSAWMEHPDELALAREALRTLSSGQVLDRFENRFRTRDGSYRWLSWTVVPSDGLLFCVARDVTADREHAAEQARLEEQLRQSQKMEAVGQLTGGIAHDFNNLLTGITGALDLMQRRIGQGRTADVERYVGLAMSSASRAAALTHRLLAFSRRQTLDPRPVDGNALVGSMEDLLRRTLGERVVLDFALSPDLWAVRCDPHQLENALLNLCINARDAMPDGGRLTVETTNATLDGHSAGDRDMQPGHYVAFCVSDTGTGMPPDVVARVFEPFFTTKPLGQGTGLGLSMIHGFARQSGGQVRIYSEVGQGTTMRVYLPRHRGDGEAQEAERHVDAPRAAVGETVLVIDDESTVRTLVAEVLGELGYAAVEAHDGASGLAVLRSNARVDLLVTDVGLPGGMNGRQVADAARALRPDLKVLFMTGYADRAAVGNGHLDPGMHLLTKPFAMEALAVKVRAIIG